MNIKSEIDMLKELIDKQLENLFLDKTVYTETINEAMRYSLLAGGKRIRPILLLKSNELIGGKLEEAMPFASAMEMIHTYSLVHDDLPAMDDDDFRRGKPTNHKVFGDAIAILAGDGLINCSYELMNNYILKEFDKGVNVSKYLRAFKEIVTSAGIEGMIGGQVVDILSDNMGINIETLKYMYKYKTAALIKASVVAGGIIGGGNEEQIKSLREYGEAVGLAFQIRDDILDIDKDKQNNKTTFLSFYSKKEAEEELKRLGNIAINSLDTFNNRDTEFLEEFVYFLMFRNK
ncbi:polyprenyl synthetase family protein [Anaerosalibacter sp. Marseille-P3206]|uniref:polyprenyl synthetase family protein n=1 Tax=Anaerosalibacter sp. Marseille-P3206 TaxID=1871005 RepID=UPI000BEA61B4|nr:farnesyl diphosphate synthase [Anaerosalibacter sp. Marseille-P3206]